jgi:uncharacterized repeat protein (TIGR03803 family)
MFHSLRHLIAALRRRWMRWGNALPIIVVATVLAPRAAAVQKYEVLYAFAGGADGQAPTGDLARDAAGNLYGTTADGGGSTACSGGCGTIYKLDPQGKETVLHSFSRTDGEFPFSVILDKSGNLYGVTVFGGNRCSPGFGTCGVVFKLDTSNTLTILHKFTGGTDGENPESRLAIDADGSVYGTTLAGGMGCLNQSPPGCGVIFKISQNETETILHDFDGAGGKNPQSGLFLDSDGTLYGATTDGGAFASSIFDYSCCWGTVFKLDKNGKETVLHSFSQQTPDSGYPVAQLIEDEKGNLYGTTESPVTGTNIFGTVFKVKKTGGPMTELFTFNYVDGGYPLAGLTRDSLGNLYGTTLYNDNGFGAGTVFKLDPAGKMTVLHAFKGGADGGHPLTVLVLDSAGNLYGTAGEGVHGRGVVFKIAP